MTRAERAVYEGRLTKSQHDLIRTASHVLNEALASEPDAVQELVETEVMVGQELRYHPSIQVAYEPSDETVTLRVFGLINGLFGADRDSWGYLCAHVDGHGKIERFGLTELPEQPS